MDMGPFAAWRWQRLFNDSNIFILGLKNTLLISFLALLLALVIGFILGLASTSSNKALKGVTRAYVEFFQNTPLAVQVFFFYNALPALGIKFSVRAIGVLGVGLYHGAYVSEVVRAGINSIPVGQLEAAKSQGFQTLQALVVVIIPQAIKIMLPPLTNQAVNLIKNTSVLSTIAGGELMYLTNKWVSSGTLNYGPGFVVAGVIYFLLCFPLAYLARKYEENLKAKTTR
ncbi:MAG: amino acid ABC transporter permease [Eubacteriaceae bacterium]|nr:amino acid ABC transporter permease [Eubacteriaceae bacterium]